MLQQLECARCPLIQIQFAHEAVLAINHKLSRHAGVVGKIDRPTPVLKSTIHELNFNPVWHVPPTTIEKDLFPRGREMQRQGQSVLVKFGIDAYDGQGRKLDPEKVDWNSSATRGSTERWLARPSGPSSSRCSAPARSPAPWW